MKRLLVGSAVVMLLVGAGKVEAVVVVPDPGSFSPSAITLDFESLSVGTAVTTQYQSLGVVFSSVNGTGSPLVDLNESGGGQGLNGGPADPAVYTSIPQDAPLLVTFVDPVTGDPSGATTAGGAFYIDEPTFIGRGLFFDVYGNLMYTFVLDQTADFWGLQVEAGDNLIGSILFDSSGGYPGCSFGADVSESYTIDNLIFEPVSAIPEPSTLAIWSLLALCGIGIGIGWRRRRKA